MIKLSKEESKVVLEKRQVTLEKKISLKKETLNSLTSRVAVCMDFSGSMRQMYKDGTVQAILERLLPLALRFDDNGEMELWIFDEGFRRMPNISNDNFYGYIEREILSQRYHMGCTCYAPIINDVVKKYTVEDPANIPDYIIFITDGGNSDHADAKKAIIKASRKPIFWQFIGIGNCKFDFLEKLDTMDGRYVDNANFFPINDLMDIEDDELYDKLLAEYPEWLQYDEVKEMIQNQVVEEEPDPSRYDDTTEMLVMDSAKAQTSKSVSLSKHSDEDIRVNSTSKSSNIDLKKTEARAASSSTVSLGKPEAKAKAREPKYLFGENYINMSRSEFKTFLLDHVEQFKRDRFVSVQSIEQERYKGPVASPVSLGGPIAGLSIFGFLALVFFYTGIFTIGLDIAWPWVIFVLSGIVFLIFLIVFLKVTIPGKKAYNSYINRKIAFENMKRQRISEAKQKNEQLLLEFYSNPIKFYQEEYDELDH